ncbi:MAG: S41 family peptidase, partial [Odoribacteraceae bacterium]|nr:S41 family peptidase [Odoribacteraceae bacterium]
MKSVRRIIMLSTICLAGSGAMAQPGIEQQTIKYNQLLRMVNRFYVDSVDVARLTEVAIVRLLEELDPHSVYLSREEVREANEPLEGGFFGIGIQFNISNDTLMVADVVPGGPSERVGLRAGDRIVTIDGENVAGIGLTTTGVKKRLKGEENSLVKVGVSRARQRVDFNIKRGRIPIHSVDASYMLTPKTGYLRVARFAATTAKEFEEAVKKLQAEGLEDLIIDLQDNPGGYMGAAIELAEHLLDARRLIVYTSGKDAAASESYYSTPNGLFQHGRVVILQDESSASASEILAGAVQDWDRGLIVGRRSFGKGLVQRPLPLQDGSMIRLTIAHYYTPSGRSIQKPYRKGDDYRAELYARYHNGEMFSPDSIRVVDTTRYFTKETRRLVRGGGGIVPDLFVPIDTTIKYHYLNLLVAAGVLLDYEFSHVDRHRASLQERYPDFRHFREEYEVTDEMIREIVAKGEEQGVTRDERALAPVIPELKRYLKALIARDLWGINEYYKLVNENNAPL